MLFRVEYLEKSKNLQEQLKELKSEIEVLKIEDKETLLDIMHNENVTHGQTKYSTLRKVCISTPTKAPFTVCLFRTDNDNKACSFR